MEKGLNYLKKLPIDRENQFLEIRNTEGTGLCTPFSLGVMVSLPFMSIQVLPPPSRLRASIQPRPLNNQASWVSVAPSAIPGCLPSITIIISLPSPV